MVRYLPYTVKIDINKLAELLISYIFALYGAPRSIISDCKSIFISKYWATICYYLIIKCCLSTAYYL